MKRFPPPAIPQWKIKKSYKDHNGSDSLPLMIDASQHNVDIFVTTNNSVLNDRDGLQRHFKFKIMTPKEILKI